MKEEGKQIGRLLKPRREKAVPMEHADLPYIGLEHVEAHTTRLLGQASSSEMKSAANRFYAGDVLYSRLRPYLNKVWHADRDGLCSSEFIIMPKNDSVDGRFLCYRLNSADFVSFANSLNAGDRPRVDFDQISSFLLPPFSLSQQRRIVAEVEKQFSRLEEGVSALKRVQANLKRYRAAVLKAACEGKLVPTKAIWAQKKISNAILTMDQGWSPRCESEPSNNDSIWAVIKTTAIQNLRFVEIENKKLPAKLKPRLHLELQAGDLLVTRAGPRSRVGVACLIKTTRPKLILCDKAYRLRCNLSIVVPAFLEIILNAPHIIDEINKLKTGISDSGVNLTQKRFGELLIPLPPLAEQKRIVTEVERRLSVIDELESLVTTNLQRASRLRQAVLQKAFEGKLVV